MRRINGALLLGILAACTPAKKTAYQQLADEINPIYLSLIPKVAVIQRLGPGAFDNDPVLAAACAGADIELERLRAISFESPEIYPKRRATDLSSQAGTLLDHRHAICMDVTGSAVGVSGNCRWWCLDRWAHFTKVAAEFEAGAAAEGVTLFPMPQVLPRGDMPPRYLP